MILTLAVAFQIQCGIQQIGSQSLSYGVLIYTSSQSSQPQLAYFEHYSSHFQEHPFCAVLKEKMNNEQTFELRLSDDGKKILEIK